MYYLFFLNLIILNFSALGGNSVSCTRPEVVEQVETACTILNHNESDGLKKIRSVRFCGSNYVWVQEKGSAKMLVHRNQPTLESKPLIHVKDANGFPLFVEFDRVATSEPKGGWVKYVWVKPGEEIPTPKISFVKLCGKKYVVGSGLWP